MDIKTLEANIIEIKKEYEEKIKIIENKLEELKHNSEQIKWSPSLNEKYYAIKANGFVGRFTYNNDIYDKECIELGNKFKTKEEAEFMVERLKVIAELRQFEEPKDREWGNFTIVHYSIGYDYYKKDICTASNWSIKTDKIYFESEETTKQAIKSVGRDRIKKYYLEV